MTNLSLLLVCCFGSGAALRLGKKASVETPDKIPVWILYSYTPQSLNTMVELNLKALRKNAPSDRYEINLVNDSNVKSLIPDLPEEYFSLPDFGSRSDVIRSALLAHYGGFYMDGDVLVTRDLSFFTDKLKDADMVSYGIFTKNKCEEQGAFSSNVMAVRKGNELVTRWWDRNKEQMRSRCEFASTEKNVKNGGCCYEPDGNKRNKCHVPWARLGEGTAKPILREILNRTERNFKIFCFGEKGADGQQGFAPDMFGNIMWQELVSGEQSCRDDSKGKTLDSGKVVEFVKDKSQAEGQGSCPCWEEKENLMCGDMKKFPKKADHGFKLFDRGIYHLFNSLVGGIPKKYSEEEVINGPWVASKIYRQALGRE